MRRGFLEKPGLSCRDVAVGIFMSWRDKCRGQKPSPTTKFSMCGRALLGSSVRSAVFRYPEPQMRSKSVLIRRSVMLDKELLDILACPKCKGDLEYDQENSWLICWACKLRYRIEDDIPIMLIDEAEKFE